MLSRPITGLLQRLKDQKKAVPSSSHDDVFVNVNKLTEKAGALYEKVRYLVDYKDERHIRRSAIERILKRKIIFEGGESVGLSLIQELVAGRYLANNTIPERAVDEVNRIIHKYSEAAQASPERQSGMPRARNAFVSFMSCEIESFFYPNNEDDFVADAFSQTVGGYVQAGSDYVEAALGTQVSLACYRSLLNSDDETLRYTLWLKYNPDWLALSDPSRIREIGKESPRILSEIQSALCDTLSFKLVPKLANHAIYFSLIREIIRAYGAESERILSDSGLRNQFIKEFLDKNYMKQYKKARGSAFRAITYIFFTKILIALALEVPYQIYILKSIEYFPIATNVVVHPLLLLFMTFSVGKLGDENTERITAGVTDSVSGEHIRLIKITSARVGFFTLLFYALYTVLFIVVFGAIISTLVGLNFSTVSILLFLSFLALVSYFALRIRHSANRWKVTKENERMVSILFNLFALPIVRAGKWLSRRFSSINLFVFTLDFIIETPFKFLLHFSDAFVSFLREKQDDVY